MKARLGSASLAATLFVFPSFAIAKQRPARQDARPPLRQARALNSTAEARRLISRYVAKAD